MAWGFRASTYADDGAGFNVNNPTGGVAPTIQLGAAAVLGDAIVVNVIAASTSGEIPSLAISDSINGSYVQAATQTWTDTGNGVRQSVFVKTNVAAGRPTITLTMSGTTSGSHFGGYQCAAYSGLTTTSPGTDVTKAGQGSATAATSGASTATTAANELVLGAYVDLGYNCTLAVGSGFTSRGVHQNDGAAWQGLLEDKDSGSSGTTQTATATAGATATYGMLCVVFKIVGGASNFPISRSITQAQALAVATSKVFLRTVSLTQAQSATVALRPSVRYFLTGTATQAQSLSVAVQQARLPNNYYTTTFPLTENPISEGNVWRLGGTDGLDWTNPRTTPGKMFATQGGADAAFPSFKDSIAVLRGTWGADQEVIVQVFNSLGNVGAYCEAEALLRFTISAHSVTGYEVTLNCNPGQSYIQINRWTGGPGGSSSSYVQIGNVAGVVSNGDVIRATVVGSTLNVYRNGTLVLGPITDTNIVSGSPGAGAFYNTNGGTADVTLWGIAGFTAHTIGTPWPLGGTIQQGQSLRLVQQPQLRRALSQAVALGLARGARLNRLLAQPQAVALSVASRVIPLLRSVTQATSASLSLRKVILRVVNTTQGQALQFVRLTRLSRAVTQSEALSLTIQSSGGGPIHPLGELAAVSTSASLTWTWIPAPAPPRPTRPVTPPLTRSPADLAPVLALATADLPPALQPAYAPVVPPS